MSVSLNSTLSRACLAVAGLTLMTVLSAPAMAGDVAVGKEKSAVCAACHGADGKSPIDPSYAILAGQYEDYLVVALKAYRSGSRQHAVMSAQARQLSNDDIDNLAAYYASLPGPLSHSR